MKSAALGLLAAMLCSCAFVHEESQVVGNPSTVESRRWIGAQLDALIGASGVPNGWKDYQWPEVMEWNESPGARAKMLDALGVSSCVKEGKEEFEKNRVRILLKNKLSGLGELSVGERVAALLVANGWTVTWAETSTEQEWKLRATRPDRAFADLTASSQGLALVVKSPCTTMRASFGGLDRDTVPSVLDPVVKDFRRLPSTKEERAAWSPMQRDPEEEQQSFELEEEPK